VSQHPPPEGQRPEAGAFRGAAGIAMRFAPHILRSQLLTLSLLLSSQNIGTPFLASQPHIEGLARAGHLSISALHVCMCVYRTAIATRTQPRFRVGLRRRSTGG